MFFALNMDLCLATNYLSFSIDSQKVRKISNCFQENTGQFDDQKKNMLQVLFKIQDKNAFIYVTKNGLTYFITNKIKKAIIGNTFQYEYSRFDIDLKGGKILKENILKEESSNEEYNFFYSHCPMGIMGVKQYKKLTIKNVYPGIDWVLYGSENEGLKHDFIVHEGVDPGQISLLYKSLNPLIIKDGNIELPFSLGQFTEKAPLSYLKNCENKVKSEFLLKAQIKRNISGIDFYETEIGFKLGSYAKKETLVIDPLQLWWGTYYGGNKGSDGVAITTDLYGNVFVLGNTDSQNLPVQAYGTLAYFQGTYGGANNGGGLRDAFILKFTNTGQLLWATYFGGSNIDRGKDIKCDNAGNVFVLGETSSTDLPLKNPGGSTYCDSTNGVTNWLSDFFVAKFSNTGQYLWGTYYGGESWDYPSELSIDSYNNLYCTGWSRSDDFPCYNPGSGAYFKNTFAPGIGNIEDAVILKFSNTGQLLLATYFGGDSEDQAWSTCCDNSGNVYFCGRTNSTNIFTLTPGGAAFSQSTLTAFSGNNGFILKLNSNCQPVWSTYIGNFTGLCSSIICDRSDNLFMTGNFGSGFPTVNPGGGAFYLANGSCSGMVMTKFNQNNQIIWSTFYGTGGTGGTAKLTLGSCNEVYATFENIGGSINCAPMQTLNPGNGAYFTGSHNSSISISSPDMYIAGFSNSGVLRWGTFFGGSGPDLSMELTCDKFGSLFYTGNQGSDVYQQVSVIQSYVTSCIINPGNGAYFQNTPSPYVPGSGGACVIGKFTPPSFNSSYSTAGCGSTNSASIQTLSGWGPYSYTWSTGSHVDSIANIPQGAYSYTITDHFFGCTETKTVFLGLPSLSFSITSPNASFCKGHSAQFIVSGANSFSWMPPQTLNASSGATVTASPLATTNYTVTGYNSPTCSSDSVINLIVHPLPIITVLGKDSVCKGSSVTYSAFGAMHYSWTPEQSFGSVSNSTAFVKPQQDVNCTIIGKDTNNCVDSTHFRIHVIPLPQMQVTGSRVICLGSNSTLTASGAERFIWAPFTNINYRDSAVVVVSPKIETSYTLTGINAKSCKDSLAITISILQLPEVTIIAQDSACSEVDFSLKAFGNGEFSWWSAASINCSQCQNATAQINTTTSFFVTLTDTNHCSNKDSLVVHLKPDCEVELIIPNIFTPNNDMVNDVFKLRGKNITTVICHILNRWGTHIYSFDKLEGFWNGDLPSGMGGADGVYFYVIYATDIRKEEHVYKGSVQLIR